MKFKSYPLPPFHRLNMIMVTIILATQACGNFTSIETTPAPDPGTTTTSLPTDPIITISGPTARPRDTSLNNFGINVDGISYYNNSAIFADMAKAISSNHGRWDAGPAEAPLDSGGNPLVKASGSVTADYPSGDYLVSWDGTGAFSAQEKMTVPIVTNVGGTQHNAAMMTHVQKEGAWISFTATPPITNIRIVAPTSEIYPGTYFLNDYINRLKPFTTIRFMGAQNIDGTTIANWSERTWPDQGSRATNGGFAYEDIIALGNILVADVWVNLPVLATDDYVCRMARLFKFGESGDKQDLPCDPKAPADDVNSAPLNITSKIYLEYSNELWGGIPSNKNVVQNMAMGVIKTPSAIGAAALADATIPWATDAATKTPQLVKVLEKRISDIVKTVYANTKDKVKFVYAIQSVYPDGSKAGFDFAENVLGPVANYIDYIGTAPYLEVNDSASGNLDDLFAYLFNVGLNPNPSAYGTIANFLTIDLAFAQKYNLPLIAYEGGQGLKGATNVQVKIAAQHDPRMFTVYQKYFTLWNQIVGHDHLFVHFIEVAGEGIYGSWGLLLHGEDLGSQKWDATVALSQNPGDLNFDGVVDSQDCSVLKNNYGESGAWWIQGDFNHDGIVDEKDLAILNANISNGSCEL